jgi:hypothetical protein
VCICGAVGQAPVPQLHNLLFHALCFRFSLALLLFHSVCFRFTRFAFVSHSLCFCFTRFAFASHALLSLHTLCFRFIRFPYGSLALLLLLIFPISSNFEYTRNPEIFGLDEFLGVEQKILDNVQSQNDVKLGIIWHRTSRRAPRNRRGGFARFTTVSLLCVRKKP